MASRRLPPRQSTTDIARTMQGRESRTCQEQALPTGPKNGTRVQVKMGIFFSTRLLKRRMHWVPLEKPPRPGASRDSRRIHKGASGQASNQLSLVLRKKNSRVGQQEALTQIGPTTEIPSTHKRECTQ